MSTQTVTTQHVARRKFNVWNLLGTADAICVTTDGFITYKNGKPKAAMRRGIAYQLKKMVPGIEYDLGSLIEKYGNNVFHLHTMNDTAILTFPVKPREGVYPCEIVSSALKKYKFKDGDKVPGFLLKADFSVIKESVNQLCEMIDMLKLSIVALPKPGCGAGERKWSEVLNTLKGTDLIKSPYKDRVYIVDYNGVKLFRHLLEEK